MIKIEMFYLISKETPLLLLGFALELEMEVFMKWKSIGIDNLCLWNL